MLNPTSILKTPGHRARIFEKMMLNTPTFAKNFDFILGIFILLLIKA